MRKIDSTTLQRVLTLLAGLLICKVAASVVLDYRNYFPPNFNSDFLLGRQGYFAGWYQWAFYTHIVSGPVSLVLGAVLISDKFRQLFPQWHRYLGRMEATCVLFLVAPSGLWMSYHAATGTIAAAGLASLAVATATCVALGWRAAVQRRFFEHRRWMWRGFVLLCSAVVIRMIGGLATVTGFDAEWLYPLSAWISWLAPLMVFELSDLRDRQVGHSLTPSLAIRRGR